MTTTSELVPTDPFQIPDDVNATPAEIRQMMAFRLRRAGASYALIAEKLGYSSGKVAERKVREVIESHYTPESIEDVVNLELMRLDDLHLIAYRRAYQGDLSAIDRILKIMERRAKYLGLDQEQATNEITNNTAIFVGGDQSEYIQSLQRAREGLPAPPNTQRDRS